MEDRDNFYQNLKAKLDDTTTFPSDYLYKFIVSVAGNKVALVQEIFHNKEASITIKKSKTGKYNSISIVIKLATSDEVISYYKQAEKIEGIISL
jgi:putative lipoic acid-binding regulatory protein